MSWNNIYPCLTEEMVADYLQHAKTNEKDTMENWLGIDRIIGVKSSSHLISVSLFWKNVDIDMPDLPTPTEQILKCAEELGLVKRYPPWQHYIEPLLNGIQGLRDSHPHYVVRVYLAADLSWLADRLVAPNCEVYLMKSSSIRHMPGALWRFLAMEDALELVTFLDADMMDRCHQVIDKLSILRTDAPPTYRTPNAYTCEIDGNGQFVYRPMTAWPLATRVRLPIRDLMEAFIWNDNQGKFPDTINYPVKGRTSFFGNKWPSYGFDEWFLSVAVYPRLAREGMFTEISSVAPGFCLCLDIEYATWANCAHDTVTPLETFSSVERTSKSASADIFTAFSHPRNTPLIHSVPPHKLKYVIGLPFLNRIDLLTRALQSIAGYCADIFLIDNSPGGDAKLLASQLKLHYFHFDGLSLSFSQSMNLLQQMAMRHNADVLITMHNDAEAPAGTPKKFMNFVQTLSETTQNWGAVFTTYDTLAAFNVTAVSKVGPWDTNLPQYFADNDYYRRMRLAGYTLHESGLQIIHHNNASSTYKSDYRLHAMNNITFPLYKEYYHKKWGGLPDSEIFSIPFDNPIFNIR